VEYGREPIFFVLYNEEPTLSGDPQTRWSPHLLSDGESMMITRLFPTVVSASVACAVVSSALALSELQEAAVTKTTPPPQSAPAGKVPEGQAPKVKVYKSAPRPKGAATASVKRQGAMMQAKKAVAVMQPAAPVAFAVNMGGQLQQMMMQTRPILRAEFHVIRAACQPTPEQRKAIARAGEQALRDATKSYVESMRRPMTPAQRAANDPRRLIEQGLVKALESHLSPDQVARYQAELTKRAAARKRLALRNLVARLDHDLFLSPDQRDKISDSLSTRWDDSWVQSIQMFMNNNNYLPQIPDPCVAPFLNDSQVKIWKTIPKYQVFFGGFEFMGGVMMNNDPLEDEELREARLAAEAKEPRQAPMMDMMKAQMKMMGVMREQIQVKAERRLKAQPKSIKKVEQKK
jgi:hypothetical protein